MLLRGKFPLVNNKEQYKGERHKDWVAVKVILFFCKVVLVMDIEFCEEALIVNAFKMLSFWSEINPTASFLF